MNEVEILERQVSEAFLALQLARAYVSELQLDQKKYPFPEPDSALFLGQAVRFELERLEQYQQAVKSLRQYQQTHARKTANSSQYLG